MNNPARGGFDLSTKALDKFLVFDSEIGDSLELTLSDQASWVGTVTHIRFSLPDDGVYEDLNAYLHISGSTLISTSTITQKGRKQGGIQLPIMFPDNSTGMKIKAYMRGVSSGTDQLRFCILDKNLKEVTTARIVVHIHLFSDNGDVIRKV